jgi:hypothetical protein
LLRRHPQDDLDWIIRVPEVGNDVTVQLIALQNSHFRGALARVDCRVDTAVGTIGLSELRSRIGQVMVTGARS